MNKLLSKHQISLLLNWNVHDLNSYHLNDSRDPMKITVSYDEFSISSSIGYGRGQMFTNPLSARNYLLNYIYSEYIRIMFEK